MKKTLTNSIGSIFNRTKFLIVLIFTMLFQVQSSLAAKGTSDFVVDDTKGERSTLYIGGDAASALYDSLKSEPIPVGEMNQDRLKMGKNIYCLAMYSNVVCIVKFTDITKGEVYQNNF